jgi:sugar phosphate isomerase/epimerase
VIVSASTACFPELSFADALSKLADLEYTSVEIAIHENGNQLKPSQVLAEPDASLAMCRRTRLTPVAYSVEIEAEGDEYYRQFHACCRLAKASKVVSLAVPAAPLGTPFNAEIERLREMVAIATIEGVLVGLRTETGCMSEDPDTVVVLCDNVKGLGVTLDPSHFIYGTDRTGKIEQLLKHVCHVRLRDTSKTSLQVRVGQGEVEYGRIVSQLAQVGYRRALSVDMTPIDDVDHEGEMRKLRLLLESLL